MKTQRDFFLEELLVHAKADPSIVLITVDMGAPALDLWRSQVPKQVISAGISEQNAINFAAGLSASGKKVYVYFMACWAARCFEQIRYSCAMANNPITILGNGVGLGYAPAGPAHEPTDDLMYMLAIDELEIYSVSNLPDISALVNLSLNTPRLRYVRFERSLPKTLEDLSSQISTQNLSEGYITLRKSDKLNQKIAIFSSGYLLSRALTVSEKYEQLANLGVDVVDVYRLPISPSLKLREDLQSFKHILILEEQGPSKGFFLQILKVMNELRINVPCTSLSLKSSYIFDNGNRDELLDLSGLSIDEILNSIQSLG